MKDLQTRSSKPAMLYTIQIYISIYLIINTYIIFKIIHWGKGNGGLSNKFSIF